LLKQIHFQPFSSARNESELKGGAKNEVVATSIFTSGRGFGLQKKSLNQLSI
jgi:hypothetical protein